MEILLTTVLLLGARTGALRAARRLGFRVLLVTDRPPAASTREGVVRHVVVDGRRGPKAVAAAAVDLAGSRRPDAVIGTTEKSTLAAAEARRRFGLPGLDPEGARRCRDKVLMKETARAAGLPCADFVGLGRRTTADELVARFGLPIVVKQRSASGGRGTLVAGDQAGLEQALRSGWMAERFVSGIEMSVETLLVDGRSILVNPTEYLAPGWANIVPADLDDATRASVLDFNRRVLAAFGIERGMAHLEIYRTPDGPVFGEIGARPPGGYLMDLIRMAYGVDPWELLLSIEVGRVVEPPVGPIAYAGNWLFHPGPGVCRGVEGLDAARDRPDVVDVRCRLRPGTLVTERHGTGQDVGYVLVRAPNRDRVASALAGALGDVVFRMEERRRAVEPAARADPIERSEKSLVRRLTLENFRCFDRCEIEPGPLTVLVGRNGVGKSHLLDSIALVAEALRTSIGRALERRGGLAAVRRRSPGHPRNFSIGLELTLPDDRQASYRLTIGGNGSGELLVRGESLRLFEADGVPGAHFRVERNDDATTERSSPGLRSPVHRDRLHLPDAGPDVAVVRDLLASMEVYDPVPDRMRELGTPDEGGLLRPDASNVASVLGRLATSRPDLVSTIEDFLAGVAPGLTRIERQVVGDREALEVRQAIAGSAHPWRWRAEHLSDATLRALAMLVAAFQTAGPRGPVRLVGLEEPAAFLHPTSVAAVLAAVRRSARDRQVLIATASADLLDGFDLAGDTVLVLADRQGTTRVGPPDRASADAVRAGRTTAGELLRLDALEPA